jgi:Late competence development protein ComFB
VKNLNEVVIEREYERLKESFAGFCGCRGCRDDVIVFALNKLPARYVTARRGAVLTHVRLQGEQEQADISVALIEGFKRVMRQPRPDHLTRTSD